MRVDTKVFVIFLAAFLLFIFVSDQSVYAAQRFLVGSGNFNDTAIWSTTSGGAGGASVPTSADWVILDANSNNFRVRLVGNVTINSMDISAGTFDAVSFYLRISNDVNITGDSLLLGSNSGHIFYANVNLSGGILDCGSSTWNLRGNFNISGGTFNAGTSSLVFNNRNGQEQTLSSNASIIFNNVTVNQGDPDNEFAGVNFDNNSTNVIVFTINGILDLRYPDQEGITLTYSGLFLPPFLAYGSNSKLIYSGQNPDTKIAQLTGDEFSSTVTVNDLEVNVVSSFTNGVDISGLGNRTLRRNLTLTTGRLTHGSGETLSVGGILSTGTLTTGGSYVGGTILMGGNQTQNIEAGTGSVANLTVNKISSTNLVYLNSNILSITGNFIIQNGIFELNPVSNGLNITGGSSVFRVQSGGTFRTGGKTITNAGTYDLQTGSTFEFNGSSQEQTPSGLSFANLRMSNPGGLNVVGNITVNGTIIFNADNNILVSGGTHTLTIGPAGSVSGYNSNRFIQGPVRKQYTGTGSFIFPIGVEELSTFYFRPATFNYTSGTFGGTSTIRIAYTRGSLPSKTLPPGISEIDDGGHYQVIEVSTAPTDFQYSFTGTFDEGNFTPETRNHALVETAASYTVAASNVVDDVANTVASGSFSELPVGDYFIVFGAGSVSGGITWDGGGDGTSWSDASNWDPDAVPTSTDDVTIDNSDATVVTIGSTTQAVAQTLTLGGTYSPTLQVAGTATNPLVIYDNSATALLVDNASTLTIINSQGVKFDPANLYDAARTSYTGSSTVEYRAGTTVQSDVYENLTVNGASSSSGTGTITVNGNMTKQSTTGFTASIPVSVEGIYTNTQGTATFTGGLTMSGVSFIVNGGSIGGTVTFTGTAAQTISGTANPAIFNSLILTNSNGLTLSTPVQVSSSLNLTNGLLTTTASLLTLAGSATASGNDNSFVYGPLARTNAIGSKEFPVGKSVYRPVTASLSGSGLTVQFEVFDTQPVQSWVDPLALISKVRYWQGTILAGTKTSGSVTLNYGPDDGVQLGDSLRMAYSRDQSIAAYRSIGGSGGVGGSGPITGNPPADSLGYFTLGSVSFDNSLPVDLAAFTAAGKAGKVLLNWETASEVNNMGFEIYRSLSKNSSYERINQELIQGKGNSNTSNYYEYEDKDVVENTTYYYKLYSRDFNGILNDYHQIATATVQPLPKQFQVAQNYPNPFNPTTRISFDVSKESRVNLEIFNMLGQKIRTLVDNGRFQPGVYDDIIWDARDDHGNSIANGIYYLVFTARDYNFRQVRKMVFMK